MGSGSERHEVFIMDQKVTKLSANEREKIKVEVKGDKNIEKGKKRALTKYSGFKNCTGLTEFTILKHHIVLFESSSANSF